MSDLMTRAQFIRKSFFTILTVGFFLAATYFIYARTSIEKPFNAASLRYPEIDSELSEKEILSLLVNSKLIPSSHPEIPVVEPTLPDGHLEPPESISLGFGESKFLIDSR
ncbi:MAG: hypothetical protein RJB13_1472, partial [Pseudomonadota bacterium]